MAERKKAIMYLVITAVLWSTGGLLIKLVEWNPVAIAGARSGISAMVMMIYLRKPIQLRGIGRMQLLGAISYAALVILFVTANKLTTSANAILLQFTAPIWVALFSGWILKEEIRKSDWAAVIAVVCGMAVFFAGDLRTGNMLGNFIAVLSGVAMAGVVIFLKLQDKCSPLEMTLLGNLVTFAIALPFYFLSVPSMSSVVGLVTMGVFQLGIAYIFYTMAIQHVSAIEAILIPIIEPLLNPVWVFLVARESPGGYALVGGTIVIGAVVLRGVYQQRKQRLLVRQHSTV